METDLKAVSRWNSIWNRIAPAISLLAYGGISLLIIFVNKSTFSGIFPYPIFVSMCQQVISTFCFLFMSWSSYMCKNTFHFPMPELKRENFMVAIPIAITFVGMVGAGNICLKYSQLSTYSVARSLTLLFNMLLAIVLLKVRFSHKCWFTCMLVVLGFALTSMDEASLDILGTASGSIASFFQACYSVNIKKALSKIPDQLLLMWYNISMTVLLFFFLIFIFNEEQCFVDIYLHFREPQYQIIFLKIIFSGIIGFSLACVSYWCLNLTSPVSYTIAGYVKSILQTLIGVYFYGEYLSKSATIGVILTITGSALYTYVRIYEKDSMSTVNENHDMPESNRLLYEKSYSIVISPELRLIGGKSKVVDTKEKDEN